MKKNINTLLFSLVLVVLGQNVLSANAGVMPWTYDKTGKKIVLLRSITDPKTGKYFFGDFGGRGWKNESRIETAARAFNQKTVFMFARMLDTKRILRYKDLYSKDESPRLAYRCYAAKIIVDQLKKGSPYTDHPTSGYRMYYLYVPFIAAKKIGGKRDDLLLLKQYGGAWIKNEQDTHFNWVPLLELDRLLQLRHASTRHNKTVESAFGSKTLTLRRSFYETITFVPATPKPPIVHFPTYKKETWQRHKKELQRDLQRKKFYKTRKLFPSKK